MLSHHQIRVIYEEGVESVAQTVRQLSQMIEVEDERLQRIIASATTAQLKKIEELTARITQLEVELLNRLRQLHRQQLTIAERNRHIAQLQDQVKGLNKQLTEAREQTRIAREAHLATVMKNSQNSSRPPSSDPHKRRRSLRQRSGRRAGGQTGHRGVTLDLVEQPDHLIVHSPKECHLCGSSLKGSAAIKSEGRQVYDLPPLKVEVTEHLAQTIICPRCGMKNKAEFPLGVNAPVQYGEGVRSVAAYLMGYQLLPYDRCAEAMNDLFGCPLSAGTLATIFKEGAREMSEPLLLIKEGLKKSEVLGVDETNLRVNQKQQWVHVSSSDQWTLLCHDQRRGTGAIEQIGLLSDYTGVCVHDGFSAYDQYAQCRHGLCNAHILRELNYVIETSKADWATEMKTLLLDIKAAVGKASEAGKKRLDLSLETEFLCSYDRIVTEAGKLYPPLKRKKYRSKTRRPKESPIVAVARKLANRLGAKRDEILLFMTDFRVPFDNNQAERDLRMLKVKQKISGCFRTELGAEEFCRLRSYVSTMKKQGHSVMETIRSVFAGKILMPALRC
jgi:transposase